MFLRIKKLKSKSFGASKYNLIKGTRYHIFIYVFGADEILLDEYLRKHFKISLRGACLKIANGLSYFNVDDYIVVKTLNPKLDSLARLITYGNENVKGSSILRECIYYR